VPSSVLHVFFLKTIHVGRNMLLQRTPKLSHVGGYNLFTLIVFIMYIYMFQLISCRPQVHNLS